VSRRFSVVAGFYRTCVIDRRHSYRHPVDVMQAHMGRDRRIGQCISFGA
jgi:hypothetical protein